MHQASGTLYIEDIIPRTSLASFFEQHLRQQNRCLITQKVPEILPQIEGLAQAYLQILLRNIDDNRYSQYFQVDLVRDKRRVLYQWWKAGNEVDLALGFDFHMDLITSSGIKSGQAIGTHCHVRIPYTELGGDVTDKYFEESSVLPNVGICFESCSRCSSNEFDGTGQLTDVSEGSGAVFSATMACSAEEE